MAFYNTYVNYNGNGTTTDFAVPFSYLSQSEVVATFTGAGTYTYTFPSTNILRVSPALASGDALKIARATSLASSKVVFANGAPITGTQLNTVVNQLIYGLQEAADTSAAVYTIASGAVTSVAAATAAASAATIAANAATEAAANATAGVVGDGSLLTVKYADGSVTTPKIADSAITAVKLGALSVTTAKIADGAVTSAKLGITPGAAGNVLTSDGTNWASVAVPNPTPTGSILINGSSTVPTGYLRCDGATYNVASYSALASVIGNLPNASAQYYTSNYSVLNTLANGVLFATLDAVYQYSTNQGATWTSRTFTPTANNQYAPKASRPLSNSNQGGGIVWTGTNYVALPLCSFLCCGTYYWGNIQGVCYTTNYVSGTWSLALSGTANVSGNAFFAQSLASNGAGTVVMFAGPNHSSFGYPTATNNMAYSTNHGVAWTGVGNGNVVGATQVANNGCIWVPSLSMFIAVGFQSGTTNARIITSPNGITWTQRTVPTQLASNVLTYISHSGSGAVVVVDSIGNIASSTDGINWTYKSTNLSVQRVVYISTVGLYYGTGVQSTDLISWFSCPSKAGYAAYTGVGNFSDGTRIYQAGVSYNPTPYTVGTQFIVPEYGQNTSGVYFNIKT